MVRNHVAIATELVIAIVGHNLIAGLMPIVVFSVPFTDIADHAIDHRIFRDEANGGIDQHLEVALNKGLRLHSGNYLRAIDRLAIVANRCCTAGQIGGQLWITRSDHRPAIDEDLRADLLGNHLSIQRNRATCWCRDATFEAQKSGVFGRITQATPPQNRAALNNIVEPGLTDLCWGKVKSIAIIWERTQEGECTRDVIIGDDQWCFALFVDVIPDLAKLLHDPLVAPTLEWPAKIDTDNLAEYPSIDALDIIIREGHNSFLSVCSC